jgi:small subunit ribosomal protein S18
MAEKRRKFSKRTCKYTEMNVDFIDYKDVDLVKISLSERGKIMPRRLTGNTKRIQEKIEIAIKRSRQMALIPYVVDRKVVVDPAYVK